MEWAWKGSDGAVRHGIESKEAYGPWLVIKSMKSDWGALSSSPRPATNGSHMQGSFQAGGIRHGPANLQTVRRPSTPTNRHPIHLIHPCPTPPTMHHTDARCQGLTQHPPSTHPAPSHRSPGSEMQQKSSVAVYRYAFGLSALPVNRW